MAFKISILAIKLWQSRMNVFLSRNSIMEKPFLFFISQSTIIISSLKIALSISTKLLSRDKRIEFIFVYFVQDCHGFGCYNLNSVQELVPFHPLIGQQVVTKTEVAEARKKETERLKRATTKLEPNWVIFKNKKSLDLSGGILSRKSKCRSYWSHNKEEDFILYS